MGERVISPAKSSRDVTALITEALDILVAHSSSARQTDGASAEPLPNLLARCESLLSTPEVAPPALREVVTFGPLDQAARRFLEHHANTVVLDALSLTPAPPQTGATGGISQTDLHRARRAALDSLVESLTRQGQRLVVLIDALCHPADLPAVRMPARDEDCRPGVVLTCHPLRSYLLARHRGQLPTDQATLEQFAQAYLRVLDALSHLPLIRLEALSDGSEVELDRLRSALDLPQAVAGCADRSSLLDVVSQDVLLYPDGTPATEMPLDTPDYLAVCARLGYVPDHLTIPNDEQAAARAWETPVLRLPPRRTDRSPSFLTGILPRVARILDCDAVSQRAVPFSVSLAELVERIEDSLGHPSGSLEAIDTQAAALPPRDGALFQVVCAAHFQASGDKLMALSLLAEAEPSVSPGDRSLRLLMAELLLRLGNADRALEALTADAFAGPEALSPEARSALQSLLGRVAPAKAQEHGHSLLLAHLEAHPPVADERRRVLIEIGTTRETVPGQGSTEKLATRCAELDMDFITVDMDPRNGRLAQRMFRRLGYPFRAVTAKGEDFLAQWSGPIDYCFLDAYDFDHGKHSELRQSRYESFLGSRIEDEACHRMHYDCASTLIEKMAPGGVICFDDTWTDADGHWTAKGKTAMPLLLENGFRLLEARNRAALLMRE